MMLQKEMTLRRKPRPKVTPKPIIRFVLDILHCASISCTMFKSPCGCCCMPIAVAAELVTELAADAADVATSFSAFIFYGGSRRDG